MLWSQNFQKNSNKGGYAPGLDPPLVDVRDHIQTEIIHNGHWCVQELMKMGLRLVSQHLPVPHLNLGSVIGKNGVHPTLCRKRLSRFLVYMYTVVCILKKSEWSPARPPISYATCTRSSRME